MHFFEYKDHQLYCEGLPVQQIAEKVGTPFYLYSYSTLVRHFSVFDQAFKGIPHLVCYSAKANSNIALLRLFVDLGGGIDVVSEENSTGPSRLEQTRRRSCSPGLGRERTRLNMP